MDPVRSEFHAMQVAVDNGRHRRGDIQVRIPIQVGNDICQVLAGLESGDLENTLPVAVNRNARRIHDGRGAGLRERLIPFLGDHE